MSSSLPCLSTSPRGLPVTPLCPCCLLCGGLPPRCGLHLVRCQWGGVVLEAFTLESSQLIWGGSWGLVFLPLLP